MIRFIWLPIVLFILAGCSTNTHNLAKGTCSAIRVCDNNGQCSTTRETMTQTNCNMIDGHFTPTDHRNHWLHF